MTLRPTHQWRYRQLHQARRAARRPRRHRYHIQAPLRTNGQARAESELKELQCDICEDTEKAEGRTSVKHVSVRERPAVGRKYCVLTSRAPSSSSSLTSSSLQTLEEIGVVLNLLQAIAQRHPTPAVRRRSPSMLSPSAYTRVHAHCVRRAGRPIHDGRRIAQSADAPIARQGATRRRGTGSLT